MPGARIFRMVTISSTATTRAEISVKVIICAQTSHALAGRELGPGERHVGEPAASGPMFTRNDP
jgi:hypothetical protein